MSKYVCENCKKQIENEADSLIIDKMSGSGEVEVDDYLAICPECLKKIVPEAREECKSCLYYEICNVIGLVGTESTENIKCVRYKDRSRFVELPFEQNKGASPFDKVAHTTYTLATESHRVASFTIEGYYLMYNEERLYTLEKDGIVILVQGSSPHDVVEKAKLAIEKLSKERESNAN